MEPVLDIRNLSIDYRTARGTVHALRDVSFAVPPKRIVGIVGESGCGKTTVINAVTRLYGANARRAGGEIWFDGRDLLRVGEDELQDIRGQQIAMVFQDPMTAQNPVISVGRQMIDIQYRESGRSREDKRRRAVAMLRRVGISDPEQRMAQFPHEFSGGMRQRISIAMALLVNPALLIADEPTTALDVTMEAQVIHLIRELRGDYRGAVLFVSHNLGLIAELCDEVVVMYAGEVLERGSVQDLFHRPCHPYTRKLLECDPARVLERSDRLPTIPGQIPDLRELPGGCIFAARCPEAFERCREQRPPAFPAGDGHEVRCHLFDPALAPRIENERPGEVSATLTARTREAPAILELDALWVRYRTAGAFGALLRRNRYPYLDAVIDVSLALAEGRTLGLAGESGSGKSTLGRAIIGLSAPHRGTIRFGGTQLQGLPDAAYKRYRRHIAMMFQDPVASLSPRRTARSLVLEPFEIHGLGGRDLAAEAQRLFDMVGLSAAFFDRYPHELSGGQARRVGVARALALNPRLVIADEPTAGLDVSVQGEILNLMGRLQRELGLTYLIISHNLPALRHVSDRIGVMYMGRLVEEGDADVVFETPAHPYTRALLDGIPAPDPDKRRALVSIEGEVPSLTDRPTGCEFHPRCRHARERCRGERPEARYIDARHVVRCHFPLREIEV